MKYILFVLSVALISCAAPYALKTRSGKPEIKVGASKKEITNALVNELLATNYVVDQQTENLVSGSWTDIDIWWGAHKRHVKQYSITEEGDSVRIVLHHMVNGYPVVTQRPMEDDQYSLLALKRGLGK